MSIPVTVQKLDAADYAFVSYAGDPTGIERCEVGNFIQKLGSGELESQMYRCQELFSSVILLVEGVYDSLAGLLAVYKKGRQGYYRSYVYPRTTYLYTKATEIRLSSLGIEVITSPNFDRTLEIIELIYKQRTKPEVEHKLFRRIRTVRLPVKNSNNPAVPRLMTLVPRLSEKAAIRLIYEYDSIWGIINTEDKELLKVEGVGKGLVSKLRENIGQCDS